MNDDYIINPGASDEQPAENKLHVDDDWKAQAQAEKAKLAEKVEEEQAEEGGHGIPEADFKTLVSQMVSQALMAMGAIPDPMSGRRMVHLELSKFYIDMLGVIEEKTKGNLEEDELELVTQALKELRETFVQLSKQVMAQQMAAADGGAGAGGDAGGIIMPE